MSITHAPEASLEDFWSDAVEGMIRRHLGMPDLGKSAVITNELHDGSGTNILLVRRPPVLSVQRVSVNGATLSPSEYTVTTYSIQLFYRKFDAGTLNVAFDYTAGSTVDPSTGLPDIDPIIRLTAAAMLAAILNYRGRGGADASIKWADVPERVGEDTPNTNVGLTSHLTRIMKQMLRRERIRVR